MKRNKIKMVALLAIIAAAGTMTSCKKSELFEDPSNSISDATAYTSPARIEKVAVGMYDALQNINYFGGRVLVYTDQRGLDATPNSYFGQMGFYTTLNNQDATVAGAWQGGYRTIYQANLFLKNFLPNASLVTTAKADQYVGEAKFIRALCYFYLVNLWGQPYGFTADASHPGVPLILDIASDPFAASNNVPRATVKQVYDQMESDLLDAEAKLPLSDADPFVNVARATKGAARALLSRLYLYKGDYAKAVTYADAIINSNKYALQSDITTIFTTYTTKESIFSVAMSGGDNPNTNNSLGQHYGANPGRGDISITNEYIALMDTTVDKRYRNLSKSYNTLRWTTKYPGVTSDYVPVARYAEILLTKAEALARLNTTGIDATALSLVQQVRDRSNGGALTITTRQELIDAIIKERRIELAFEGHSSFEFNRLKQDIPAHGLVPAQAYGSNLRVLPVPKYETDKNPNLQPNPGY